VYLVHWSAHADALSLAVLKGVCNIHLQVLDTPALADE
jgi:hypothetical protein